MQGEAEADGNPPTRSSAAPCVSSTNEKLFTVVPIFRVSRMSSRPRGTTKVVPFFVYNDFLTAGRTPAIFLCVSVVASY